MPYARIGFDGRGGSHYGWSRFRVLWRVWWVGVVERASVEGSSGCIGHRSKEPPSGFPCAPVGSTSGEMGGYRGVMCQLLGVVG